MILSGLIGRSILSSRSPWLHEQEAKAQGLALRYELFDFTDRNLPDDALDQFVRDRAADGYAGLNMTYPFKQRVIPMLDDLSRNAAMVGAVNTIAMKDGRLVGHNTDMEGFRHSFAVGLPHVAMDNVLLLDMAIHTLDAARYMSGKTPRAVYCLETNPPGSWYRHGAAANAIFEFDDNVVFNYRGSWAAEGANTSWESAWRIVGTKGTVLWDGADQFLARVVTGDSGFFRDLQDIEVPAPAEEDQTHGHASVIADFLDAIETGRTPETHGADNIKSLAMVFAAIESAKAGQRMPIFT